MCQHVIELTGLTKKYGGFTAVNDLNLTVEKGDIFGLLGPNGAGKSTTILMMLGLTGLWYRFDYPPDRGEKESRLPTRRRRFL